jgi:murein DD-endopeptidase MepM/ murein hydrolase activator NlpD
LRGRRGIRKTSRESAQGHINDWIKNHRDTVVNQGTSLGKVGTEGASDGYHLHFQVDIGANTPVNLFHWADSFQNQISVHGNASKDMHFMWSNDAGTVVNNDEKIAMRRVEDAAGPQNVAYAWTNDFSAVRPETWVRVKWVELRNVVTDDGVFHPSYITWIQSNNTENIIEWKNNDWHLLHLQ